MTAIGGGGGIGIYNADPSVTQAGAPGPVRYSTTVNREIDVESHALLSDGGDYSYALNRALGNLQANGGPRALKQRIRVTNLLPIVNQTATMFTGSHIVAESGSGAGFYLPGGSSLNLLSTPAPVGNDMTIYYTDIQLDGLMLKGGRTDALDTAIPYVPIPSRLVKLWNCAHVKVSDCVGVDNVNWTYAFQRCQDITVRNHRHENGSPLHAGSRDALHFLDCANFSVDGLYGYSGDSPVGITALIAMCTGGRVSNVIAQSDTSPIVVINMESAWSAGAGIYDMRLENIKAIDGVYGASVVFVASAGAPVSLITGNDIGGVGTGNSGLYVNGDAGNLMKRVTFTNVNVASQLQYGMNLQYLDGATIQGYGEALGNPGLGGNYYDGVYAYNCSRLTLDVRSTGSARYGLSIDTCTNVDAHVGVVDNGQYAYASGVGGGVLVKNSDSVNLSGIVAGTAGVSRYGINNPNATRVTRAANMIVTGSDANFTGNGGSPIAGASVGYVGNTPSNVTPNAAANTYGAAVNITPDTGYAALDIKYVTFTATAIGAETLTCKIEMVKSDGTTSTAIAPALTALATVQVAYTSMPALTKDGVTVSSVNAYVQSTIAGSTATVTAKIVGQEQ